MDKLLFCFGDSNTYGYDPRNPLGDRYAQPWPELLGEQLSRPVRNAGRNGQCIPVSPWEQQALLRSLEAADPGLLILLLGTNDILQGHSPEAVGQRIRDLLSLLRQQLPQLPILLLSPPPVRLPELRLCNAMAEAAQLFRSAAEQEKLPFLDLQGLPLPLAWDGIHLTEEGHRLLAAVLAAFLQKQPEFYSAP